MPLTTETKEVAQTKVQPVILDLFPEMITELLRRTEEQGHIACKDQIVDLYNELKTHLPDAPIDYALERIQEFSPIIYECMRELSLSDNYLKEELELADDVTFTACIQGTPVNHTLMIREGQFYYSLNSDQQADLTCSMDHATYRSVMIGEVDAMDAFMDGNVALEGSVTSCVSLRAIFEVLCDEFGFKIIDLG